MRKPPRLHTGGHKKILADIHTKRLIETRSLMTDNQFSKLRKNIAFRRPMTVYYKRVKNATGMNNVLKKISKV